MLLISFFAITVVTLVFSIRHSFKMFWSYAFTLALFASTAQADKMLRFSCSGLVTQRLDPVVQPGSNPSQHVHQIVGGDAFNFTMDTKTYDVPKESSCTTCTFTDDFSNYWTPALYFRSRNGTFKKVPQMANQGFNGAVSLARINSVLRPAC